VDHHATQKLKELAISESGFVFDPRSGATFSTNASGLLILDALKRKHARQEIVVALEEAFVLAAQADLARDVDEFVHLLRSHGLLPADFSLVEPGSTPGGER